MVKTSTKPDLKQIKIKLIAVVGKAGSGKDFLSSKWAKERDYHKIISSTTRPPRDGEVNGIDYNFVSEEDFATNDFLESAEFRSWHYGTKWSDLDPHKVNIGVFNPSGIYQLWELRNELDLTIVYAQASDKIRLIRQLNREEEPDVGEIIRRFGTDEEDFIDFDDWFAWHLKEKQIREDMIIYIND